MWLNTAKGEWQYLMRAQDAVECSKGAWHVRCAHAAHRTAVGRPHRRPDLLLQKPRRNAELVRPVSQRLVDSEVLRQSDVSENRLLQLAVEVVELAVDVDARKLVFDPAVLGLQPVDVRLVALYLLHQTEDMHGRLHAVSRPCFDDDVVCCVQEFHCPALSLRPPFWANVLTVAQYITSGCRWHHGTFFGSHTARL